MKENPSYHEWLQFTPEERGDTWLYDPLYKKPWESWDNYGREPTVLDTMREFGQVVIEFVKYVITAF